MTIILFDDHSSDSLLPLTYTRPAADLRVGILTIAEKWEAYYHSKPFFKTAGYLQEKYSFGSSETNLFINGAICPDEGLLEAFDKLADGQALFQENILLGVKLNGSAAKEFSPSEVSSYQKVTYQGSFNKLNFPEDIFQLNDSELRRDFRLLSKGRTSATLSSTNTIIGDEIFVEDGVEVECSTLNTKDGPIYIGKDSQIWEGCHIRGSFALCEDSQVKMGAKIYGKTTIGPHCRVGGEINNVVIWGNSSKGHEGYLGNAVLGEWCNIGADTNNSNLKNNYAEVRLWDYAKESFRRTGLQFCGLIMADHAKCGINTMFNTGTVVGVSANVFGAGFPRNFVADFAWGGSQGFEVYSLKKMFETAHKVYERRNREFDEVEQRIVTEVFNLTEKYRRF